MKVGLDIAARSFGFDLASQTGAATLAALNLQSETLQHIRDEQRRIDDDLSTSGRLLRGLESWRGAASNALFSWWGFEDSSAAQVPVHNSGYPAGHAPTNLMEPRAASARCNAIDSARASTDGAAARRVDGAVATDPAISQLSALVSGLQAQAVQINQEIRCQSSILEEACTSADAHSLEIQRHAQRTKALLRR